MLAKAICNEPSKYEQGRKEKGFSSRKSYSSNKPDQYISVAEFINLKHKSNLAGLFYMLMNCTGFELGDFQSSPSLKKSLLSWGHIKGEGLVKICTHTKQREEKKKRTSLGRRRKRRRRGGRTGIRQRRSEKRKICRKMADCFRWTFWTLKFTYYQLATWSFQEVEFWKGERDNKGR